VRSQEAVRSGDRTILDKQRAEGHAETVWIPGRASDETLSVFYISFWNSGSIQRDIDSYGAPSSIRWRRKMSTS
jgi:hypothetical protein